MAAIVLSETLSSRTEFYQALATASCTAGCRPHNLDGMVDFLREHQVDSIVAQRWALSAADTQRITAVLRAEGVDFYYSEAAPGQ